MYEYKVLMASSMPSENNLNQLGEDGWRMVQLVPYQGEWILYLVRERSN